MKKILVIGSTNIDLSVKTKYFPEVGETMFSDSFSMNLGGKGANQAIACSILSNNVTFLTALGNDNYADYAIDYFKKYNINFKPIIKYTNTGCAFINVNEKGDNKIIVNSGANMLLSPNDIHNHIELIKDSDYILLQLEIPMDTIKTIVSIAKQYQKTVILNPAPYQNIDFDLSLIDYLTPNEIELKQLVGSDDNNYLNNAKLLNKKVNNLIVTLGGDGSAYFHNDEMIKVPAYPVEVIDTTGAGDCYSGLLTACLANGNNLAYAMKIANIGASLSVTKIGTISSYPTKEDILKAMNN